MKPSASLVISNYTHPNEQVAVDDATLMGRFEGFGDLLGNRQRLIQRDRPLRDPLGEGRPLDQLQHERPRALGFLDAVDGGDVRVVEAGEDLRLPLEPGEAIRISREGVGEDLQRDLAVQLRVGGLIHLTPCRLRRSWRGSR